MREWFSNSEEETLRIGREIAKTLKGDEVIILKGELGAGKTHLVKGVAAFLGIDTAEVHSPTFAIVHEYQRNDGKTFYHFDCYRIKHPDEILELGWDYYLGESSICIIEWPEKIEVHIPKERIEIVLEHAGIHARKITLHGKEITEK